MEWLVLQAIAQHQTIRGLIPAHLEMLCQHPLLAGNEAIISLRLDGLLESMILTEHGKRCLGEAKPMPR